MSPPTLGLVFLAAAVLALTVAWLLLGRERPDEGPGSFDRALRGLFSRRGLATWVGLLLLAGGLGLAMTGLLLVLP